jgi:hypothetical protein
MATNATAPDETADLAPPTEEETAAILAALESANASLDSILARMDRSHDLLQGSIADLQAARAVVAESNAAALAMQRTA